MKLPLSWLKDFVNIDVTAEELSDKLLGIGFEVEEIIYTGKNIENVVVGKIISVKKHFSADKLQVCMVDVGKKITQIVTAATNISVGNCVPVALDGADLPTGKHIVASELRGAMSYGMFCSGKELMIDNSVIEGAEVDGILILPENSQIGQDIRETLGLNEYILDISIPANRSDCQSIYGMAREIGALYGKKAKKPATNYKEYETEDCTIPSIEISDTNLCSLYTGRLITDIKIEQSPKWMRDRLRHVGIRSINNLVDVTNYVLIEVGQPLHAFDAAYIDGNIFVRRAYENEKIIALDEKEYTLNNKMLVIADEKKPLAIAGVMGGEYSGISKETKCVFLEAARFAKDCVRKTSRALGLRSDSSARYEKGVDWSCVDLGRERALCLLSQLKAGKVTTLKAQDGLEPPKAKVIKTSAKKINDLFGIEIKQSIMLKTLKALEFSAVSSGNEIICTVPDFREDIDNFTDLAEEIIRFYGYDSLRSDLIADAHPTVGGLSVRQKNIDGIKAQMTAYGAYECCSYSFINPKQFDKLGYTESAPERKAIAILNPLSEEFSVMRTELVGSMLNVVAHNQSKKIDNFRLFEISKIYLPKSLPLDRLPAEHDVLCIAFVGKNEDFYKLKSAVKHVVSPFTDFELSRSEKPYLHPGISADIVVKGKIIGSFGKVHPVTADAFDIGTDVYVAEIDLSAFIEKTLATVQFKPIPKFPTVDRDLAVTVEEKYTVGELSSCIKEAGGELCVGVELFDIYRGEQIEQGYKSVAFNIKLRSETGTLIDAEIQQTMDAIILKLNEKFGAKLR